MQKRAYLISFLLLAVFTLFGQQKTKEAKKIYTLQKAYAFQEESLLVSDTDNNCTFFIRRESVPDDIQIVGAKIMDAMQTTYSNFDEMFINGGARNGLKEGDMLLVIGKGKSIANPFGGGRLGTYYLKKSLATVTCIYDDRAVISLNDTCNPVEIGDIAIPYKPEKTIFRKKLVYSLCRIPPTPLEGRIVYMEVYTGLPKEIAGLSDYVAVDLGEGLVEKGTFLLLYRILRDDLPPFIIGLGIVIHPETNVSTIKILDAYTDIRVGDRVAVMAGVDEVKVKKEEIPVVETLGKEAEAKKEEAEKRVGEEAKEAAAEGKLVSDIYFDFDSKVPPANINAELEKVASFIQDKSEYVVILRGYCCSIGNDEYNLKLSQERVEAVKALLTAQYKVDPAHIETYFYGEKDPLFDNSQESERKKNRLVKIEVAGK